MTNKTGMSQEQLNTSLLDACPFCGAATEEGFGLAGGGYGIYVYCPNELCKGDYFAKIQVED